MYGHIIIILSVRRLRHANGFKFMKLLRAGFILSDDWTNLFFEAPNSTKLTLSM
jgi:hypothetical protein